MYVQHVHNSYGLENTTVVFDGYPDKPSTKDHAHIRRSKGVKGAKVHFTEDMPCSSKKEHFLSNTTNKQNFIYLLGTKLQASGCIVLHAEEDADRLIVDTAVTSSLNQSTILVADDTDVLVLLIHHATTTSQGLFMQKSKMTSKKNGSVWDILQVKQELGEDVCKHILFAHALLGCDATSGIFGLGKALTLKKVKQSEFRKHADVFRDASSTKCMIEKSGEAALLSLYGCSEGNLNDLRYKKFCQIE